MLCVLRRCNPSPLREAGTLVRAMASDTLPPDVGGGKKGREKVLLKPGFHLTDWMSLMKKSDFSCRNGGPLRKVSMAELATHNSQFDCWTAYNGKVYNLTQYLHYHPGGVPKLLEGAGKDCTKLFNKYHSWVNIDSMLSKCVVGILIADDVGIAEGDEAEGGDEGGPGDVAAAEGKSERKIDGVEEMRARAKELLLKEDDDDDDAKGRK